jgi:hypothetical protein
VLDDEDELFNLAKKTQKQQTQNQQQQRGENIYLVDSDSKLKSAFSLVVFCRCLLVFHFFTVVRFVAVFIVVVIVVVAVFIVVVVVVVVVVALTALTCVLFHAELFDVNGRLRLRMVADCYLNDDYDDDDDQSQNCQLHRDDDRDRDRDESASDSRACPRTLR